jgi:hypothetical protein
MERANSCTMMQVKQLLWWKKYLTKMQMIQFVVFFVHALQPLFVECHYPKVGEG